jgi:hypothetical protein
VLGELALTPEEFVELSVQSNSDQELALKIKTSLKI